MKTKFIVYGNCQIEPLKFLLLKSKKFSDYFTYSSGIKPVHLLRPEDTTQVITVLKNIDCFIYQKVGLAYGDFSTDPLMGYLKDSCHRICVPNSFFRGYNPETIYFKVNGKKISGFCDYHDANVLREWIRGASLEKMERMLRNPDYYSKSFISQNAEESLNELEKRESECDITISDFIKSNWIDQKLFHTINHPSNNLLIEMANRILKIIGIPKLDKTELDIKKELIGGTVLPIYKSIKDYIKITCNEDFKEDIKIRGSRFSFFNYLQKIEEQYNELLFQSVVDEFEKLKNSSSTLTLQLLTRL
jgi:hypothetical protein